MMNAIFNAKTKEEIIIEVHDELFIEQPTDIPPTTEERIATLETNQTSIIETIAEIVGV